MKGDVMKPILLVLAAGVGSRYGGVKQIDGVGRNNETLLEYATYDARECGYGKVVYIIRQDIEKDFRERLFDRVARNFDAEYVFQVSNRTKPWGTVHALLAARNAVKSPFTAINADDYYGRSAFKTLGAYLSGVGAEETNHAMAGYVLENTMSKAGSVSRGICSVKDGVLIAMRENTKISYTPEGGIVTEIDGGTHPLTGKEYVSMNFFGFTPAVFDFFEGYWEDFYAKNKNSEKAECLLPDAVSEMAARGRGVVKFFSSEEAWFGMTYPEDRALVKEEIAKKTAAGYYPEQLWEKL
jgi:NDP-sugar pyrophosphorylase family protein